MSTSGPGVALWAKSLLSPHERVALLGSKAAIRFLSHLSACVLRVPWNIRDWPVAPFLRVYWAAKSPVISFSIHLRSLYFLYFIIDSEIITPSQQARFK
jgi:hypothetical protein